MWCWRALGDPWLLLLRLLLLTRGPQLVNSAPKSPAVHDPVEQRFQEREKRNTAWKNRELKSLRRGFPFKAAQECSPVRGNSTLALVRCAVSKTVDEDVVYNRERQDELTWKAMDYIYEKQDEGERYAESQNYFQDRPLTAIFPEFKLHRSLLHQAAGAYPRVFVLDTWGDDPDCEDPDLGYTYFLEHWMRSFFKPPNQAIVHEVQAADYVYLPFCIRMKLFLTAQKQEQTNARVDYLQYEGKLLRSAVRYVDLDYLVAGVQRAARTPEFVHCMERESCRFLTTSIDGRHVYRNFSSLFGNKLVFMTYMGMTDWVQRQPGDLYWTDLHAVSMRGHGAPWLRGNAPKGCRAACLLHCRLEPPAVLPDDLVLPWTVVYKWNPRSEETRSRDLLAFFSGSTSSCSRDLLMRVFRTEFFSSVRGRGPLSAGADLSHSVLVFPSLVKLEQPEWSELAYRSKICLVPDGDCTATVRLIEVIMHGCVPMIITNRLLPPLHQYIDWRKIAFFVREDEIPALPGILAWISKERRLLDSMQKRLVQVARFFDFGRDFPSMLLVALRKKAEERRRPTKDGWGY